MSKNSLKAATLAAAKVNAMLYAKGKLKLPDNQKFQNHSGHGMGDRSLDSLITREYEINDVPAPARNLLTRGFVQDEICKYSGASISTRGRYLTYEEKLNATSKDRPLYLHIQGSSKESVNLALARIQEMIAQFDKSIKLTAEFSDSSFPSSRVGSFNGNATVSPISSGGHYVQDKVFVGLESSSSAFSVRERILGPGGSFLQHIKIESGATVTLRGRGSGNIEPTSGQEAFEPMYIHLTHPKPEGLQAAKILALNLIDTVHAENSVFQQQSEQALMPVGMGAPSHLPFQGHVAVVSSVPTILTQPMISSMASGLNMVPVSSVQVIGQPMTSPSQGIYTSSHGNNFGFQGTFVNTLPDVTNVAPLPALTTVPMRSVTPVNLNTGPPLGIGTGPAITLGSVPIETAAPPPTNVNLNAGLVRSIPMNPVTSMTLSTMAPMPVNSVTSIPMSAMPPVNSLPPSTMAPLPVTSLSLNTMSPITVNPVTSMPLNTVQVNPITSLSLTHVPLNLVTTMPPGPITSVPLNLLPGMGSLPLDGAIGPPQIPLNQAMMPTTMMAPPPMPQNATGYREMVGQHIPQPPLPPTTYAHLYLKQKQQLPILSGPPPPIQHGHKRKFTEEGPDVMPPPPMPPIMPHRPPYSLQAGAALANGPGTERPFLGPPPSRPRMVAPGANKRHMAPRGDVDRDLMPPPVRRTTNVVAAQPFPARIKQDTTQVGSRTCGNDLDGKRLEGALGGLAALYNSDDSDDDAGSVSKSSPINNYK